MYQAPKLEKFGTFRQLTLGRLGKTVIGDDAIPGIGLDCNPNVPPSDPTGCIRS
ncbi:MAG: lasso RiPP family leader peptide-containing protein [Gemmatimonadaceae bacterium]